MKKSKQYKNPPLESVFCELKFKNNKFGHWTSLSVSEIYKKLKKSYSELIETRRGRVQFDSIQATFDRVETDVSNLVNYETGNEVALTAKGFEFTNKKKYPGWDVLLPKIKEALDVYLEVTKPDELEQLTVRFTNKIYIPLSSDVLEERAYFNVFPDYSKLGLSASRFDLRIRVGVPKEVPINFVMMAMPTTNGENYMFVMDFEMIYYKLKEVDSEKIIHAIDEAHARIEQVFENSITDKLRTEVFS